jgi:uncharacterized paraquat-inducible protein A
VPIYKTSVYRLLINTYIILVPDDMTTDYNKNISNNKQFIIEQLKWLVVYICIGFVISYFLSFPTSLVIAFGTYVLIFYLREKIWKKKCINLNKTKSIFDFLSSSSAFASEPGQLKYYCMSCAMEHRELVCPNCGSKMRRAGI